MSAGTGTVPGHSTARALELLRAHADHPSAVLALNRGTLRYTGRTAEGLVAHTRRGRRHVVQFAAPFAAGPDGRGRLLDEFLAHLAAGRGPVPRLTAAQVGRDDVPLYAERGFAVNQVGSTYGIDLARFTVRGKPLAKVRQNVNRARREGVTVVETDPGDPGDRRELDAIDAEWLAAKGRHVKELAFLVGERGGPAAALRRTFLARHRGRTVGYVTYSPVWGGRPGWLYDLTRRSPRAPVGTVELVNLTALTRFREEGAPWLHLGLTPFAGLDDRYEPACASRGLARALRLVAEHGRLVYPAGSQEAFKLKWAPHVVEPEYVAFQHGVGLPAVWHLLRTTGAV
ncbi:phosphatidylglycerol lysyltransferase domain-containing protein [Streptomyces sp. NPDC090077]|uniref:phosphatidylglycerol lysyltransferase domain-containing protein n=1 Tax=Streptomyces sp. NPDC090077 TaxID=3365938 RepID=UPI00381C6951